MHRLLIALAIAVSADAQSVVSLDADGGVPIRFIVPLGIEAPPGSASAFRIVARIPAGVNGELTKVGRELRMTVESELLPDAPAPETPSRYPRSRLSVPMLFPYPAALHEQLKYQRGSNRLQSPVIIAIADPRASIHYTWPPGTDRRAAGCYNCSRPAHLIGKTEADGVYELFTNGRHVSVRPVAGVFVATPYAFYGEGKRLEIRVPTVMADTIRPPAVLVAASAPPVAGGLLQETTYLHSGELETGAVDLDAGGRAGWNVVLDRTYRSSTIGVSPLGAGWDASMFRRLRVLPNGKVEYRDGAGEIWVFAKENETYVAPRGLFLRLSKTATGWLLADQRSRFTMFDELGRLASESDEFFDPNKPSSGNTIHYLYGSDGHLATIVDAVGRATVVNINPSTGLLMDITDWRSRRIDYSYDAHRLNEVKLPEVANTSGQRPRIAYGYETSAGSLKEQLEIAPNLITIRDPKETLSSGLPRVTFHYVADRVMQQDWATGEKAAITYNSPTSVTVKDVLGQERRYALTANNTTDPLADRAHATEVREVGVPVWSGAAFGQLASKTTPGAPSLTQTDRVQTFTFDSGVTKTAKLDGVRETTLHHEAAKGAPGLVVKSTTSTPIHAAAAPFISPAVPIARTFSYQTGSFLDAIAANGRTIEIREPLRSNPAPTATNDAVAVTTRFDANGLLQDATSSGGTDPASAGSTAGIRYYGSADPIHTRGRPKEIREGESDGLVTTISYPSATVTVSTDSRAVVTTTTVDAWDRPIEVKVEKPGSLTLHQTFAYDATGRMEKTTERKGTDEVVTSFTYDVMGRRTSASTNNIATVGSITSTTEYNLGARKIITRHPGGAITTRDLDPLGRTTRTFTDAGSKPGASPIEQRFAYDLAGNRVFATDMVTVATSAFDGHGRAVATCAPNGTVSTTEYDEWNHPRVVKSLDKQAAITVAQSTFSVTPAGRMESMKTAIDAARSRTTAVAWDGAGRTTRTATNERALATTYDLAGRLRTHVAGAGDLAGMKEIFTSSKVTDHDGELPRRTESSEKSGSTYTAVTERNTTGDATSEKVGPLEWKTSYDELGNVTAASVPGRPPANWDVDARGAVETEKLPDGAENKFAYDGSGSQTEYEDPTNEATLTVRDLLGRPLKHTYLDGTTELIEWEGSRVKSVTDRQKRKQTYVYDGGGEVTEIRDGAGTATDVLEYDNAGRLISWRTTDTELTWGEFDLDGNPRRTSQKRFRDGSGLRVNMARVLLDEVVQQHRWNEHGERTQFSMPVADGATVGAGWTKWLQQRYDALGNITAIERIEDEASTAPVPLMTGAYRAGGRPDVRTLLAAGGPIVRKYDYHAESSLLNRMDVTAKGVPVAGSAVQHNGLQTAEARLLGVASGERVSKFAYDDRSRLTASLFGARAAADPQLSRGSAKEDLDPADFRKAQERTKVLNPLASVDTSNVDPPSATFEEKPGGGHKIDKVTKGPVVRPFSYDGAERIDDGRFVYTFDARGRLIRATEKSPLAPLRRSVYTYTGTGRLVGRRAEYSTIANPNEGDWKLEDRPQILADDGLPAEATFAWDPITDRLLAVYRAGNTSSPLKQIIHGESVYDDPLETTTIDRATGNVIRLYPIYDEAAAGSLQTVLSADAEVVARNLTNDPYGAHDVALTGPAIDGAAITARKNAAGAIIRVDVALHATEQLAPTSLMTGIRVAALDADGALVRLPPVAPTLAPDPYTVRVTFTASEWATFTAAPATTLSIAATSTLRASTWGKTVPIMPAPEWAVASQPVFTSPDRPVEVRQSLASLSTYLAGIPADTERTTPIYEVETLPLLGVPPRGTALAAVLSAGFQALPFAEPVTGLVYARARWYDPGTGSFLSPDPMGYRGGSSNLYAFGGGDPINNRDPLGEFVFINPKVVSDALTETKRAVKNVAIGARELAIDTANFVLNFGQSDIQNAIHEDLRSLEADAQDPTMGRTVDQRLIRRKANQIRSEVDTFSAASHDAQQRMVGRATLGAFAIVLPAARGLLPRRGAAVPHVEAGITTALHAQRRLQSLAIEMNSRLAANPALARTVLTPAEYAAGQQSAGVAAMQWGNAVERLVALEIESSPELRDLIKHVGGSRHTDFEAFGLNYDTHTENLRQVIGHQNRPYTPVSVTYERPKNFSVFP